jgi:hypothetical protein
LKKKGKQNKYVNMLLHVTPRFFSALIWTLISLHDFSFVYLWMLQKLREDFVYFCLFVFPNWFAFWEFWLIETTIINIYLFIFICILLMTESCDLVTFPVKWWLWPYPHNRAVMSVKWANVFKCWAECFIPSQYIQVLAWD